MRRPTFSILWLSVLLLWAFLAGARAEEAGAAAAAAEEDEDGIPGAEVVILTASNFEHDTQAASGATTGDWFVKFYAPWCGHCVRLAPTWDELAGELTGKVNVAKLDATANRDVAKRFGVSGYPTLLFFSQGKYYRYKGKRDLEALSEFALGGFKYFEAMTVPKENPGLMDMLPDFADLYAAAVSDWSRIKQGKKPTEKGLAVLITLGVLLCIGMWLFLYFSGGKEKIRVPAKKD